MQEKRSKLTFYQIAELTGTSKSTVSRVMMNDPKVAPATREKVLKVVRENNYQPSAFARGLSGGKTGLVAVLSIPIESGYFAEVIRSIDAGIADIRGHLLCSFAHSDRDYVKLWQKFSSQRFVDGIILIAPPSQIYDCSHPDSPLPTVICSSRPPKNVSGWNRVDRVVIDNCEGFKKIMEQLVRQGCRNFIHVAGPGNIYDSYMRKSFFEAYIATHNDLNGRILQAGLSTTETFDAVTNFIKQGGELPDAFVCVNDSAAIGTLEALRHLGLPQVAITGCDGEPIAKLLSITTLKMSMERLGREAAQLLKERMADLAPESMREVLVPLVPAFRKSSSFCKNKAGTEI